MPKFTYSEGQEAPDKLKTAVIALPASANTFTVAPPQRGFDIRIDTTQGETALQRCHARNAAHAWDLAFVLAQQLLGEELPKRMSVKPTPARMGLLPMPMHQEARRHG